MGVIAVMVGVLALLQVKLQSTPLAHAVGTSLMNTVTCQDKNYTFILSQLIQDTETETERELEHFILQGL